MGDSLVRSLAENPTDRPTLTPSDITLPRPASHRPSAADLARRRLLASEGWGDLYDTRHWTIPLQ
jgi:hypothetical protein